jgi:hypothetical protein
MEARELHGTVAGAALLTVTSPTRRQDGSSPALPVDVAATWLPWVYIMVGIATLAVRALRSAEQWLSPDNPVGSVLAAATGLVLCIFVVDATWMAIYLYVNAYGLISRSSGCTRIAGPTHAR